MHRRQLLIAGGSLFALSACASNGMETGGGASPSGLAEDARIARAVRKAHFPFLRTIDDFDFTFQSTLRLQMMGSFLSPDFVTDGRSLILSGKTGRGKTHLAVAIAYKAIQNGFDALFTTCTALVDELSTAAAHKGRFKDTLARFTHPNLLVVDEVGYLTYGTDAANVLFHVVNERNLKKRAMIFTTNKALTSWGRVLHDEDLADVIIDRVLERGRHIKLDGPSVRTDKHPDLDKPGAGDQDLARVSGTARPEIPEPTPLHVALPRGRSEVEVRVFRRGYSTVTRKVMLKGGERTKITVFLAEE